MLAENCALALALHKDGGQEFLPPVKKLARIARPKKEKKTFTQVCKWHKCKRNGEAFTTTNGRQNYCSKDCRDQMNWWKYARQKKVNSREFKERKKLRDEQWRMYEQGLISKPPLGAGGRTEKQKRLLRIFYARMGGFKLISKRKELGRAKRRPGRKSKYFATD